MWKEQHICRLEFKNEYSAGFRVSYDCNTLMEMQVQIGHAAYIWHAVKGYFGIGSAQYTLRAEKTNQDAFYTQAEPVHYIVLVWLFIKIKFNQNCLV